jgi:ADP-heptose:LPS heptosyltransferase
VVVELRRVMVARLDHLGDVLLSGPAVRAVANSGVEVVFLAGHRGVEAAHLLAGITQVATIDAPWIDVDPRPLDRATADHLVDLLASLDVDEAVVLTSFHQSALPLAMLLRMAGVGRIGAISEDYPGSLLDVRIAPPVAMHEVERALHVAAACGHELPVGDDGHLALRDGVGVRPTGGAGASDPEDREIVVIHPGASVPARTWSADGFRATAAALASSGRRVVVTGSPAEAELVDVVRASDRRVVPMVCTSLAELAGILAVASVVVAGNTGPAHLAAAVGTPVVSIFPPTVDPVAWRPWGVAHVLLGDHTVPCRGCRAKVCPRPGHPCLAAIGPADVLDAVATLEAASPIEH